MNTNKLLLATALVAFAGDANAQTTQGASALDSIRLPVIEMPPPLPRAETQTAQKKDDAKKAAPRIIVIRNGDSVAVAVPKLGKRPVLSEPFYLRDRVRLYLTYDGVKPATMSVDDTKGTGLLSVETSTTADAFQVIVEAPGLRSYRVQSDEGSATLWLRTDTVASRSSVVPPLPTASALPRPPLAEALNGEQPAAVAAEEEAEGNTTAQTSETTARTSTAKDRAAALLAIANTAVRSAAARTLPVLQSPAALGAISSVALGLIAMLAVSAARRRRASAVPVIELAPAEPAHSEEGRIWAARTLAVEGLDAATIAKRTGLPRDAARLLILRERPKVPPAAGSAGRQVRPGAGQAVAARAAKR